MKHTLIAIKYKKKIPGKPLVVEDTIEEQFFSIYNLERRKFELEDQDYKTEVNKMNDTLKVAA